MARGAGRWRDAGRRADGRADRGLRAQRTFKKGAYLISFEAGGGNQENLEGQRKQTDLDFVNAGVRFSLLPFGPTFSGPLFGALEVGLEPFYQRYVDPVDAFFAGLGLAVRYHVLSIGRFVPYVEVFGAAGGTDLDVRETRSTFTFLVFGGIGASFFLTDRTALYAGYRLQHVSNGGVEDPNLGFESHTGGGRRVGVLSLACRACPRPSPRSSWPASSSESGPIPPRSRRPTRGQPFFLTGASSAS